MIYQHICVERRGRVTIITLNRPEVMNALNYAMHCELQAAFDDFAGDAESYVTIVTGAGPRAFCAGSDLKAVSEGEWGLGYPENGYAGLIQRFDLDKPLIAAVNGVAFGGGFEIALACDLIIAADTASFALPEPRVGAIAFAGGIHRLARQIGLKRAMGYLLTARRISAAEGLAMGLVNEVVPPADLLATALGWCDEILACAPLSVHATKQLAMCGLGEADVAAAITAQDAYPAYATWRDAEDTVEGPLAFAKKRAPVWQGR